METVQYITNEAGGGLAIAIIAIAIAVWLFRVAWSGTFSEEAQRRNVERGKKEK